LISVKETNQRKRCLSKANPGSHRRGDFSTGHPCPIEKRRTSCAAPSGSAGHVSASRFLEAEDSSNSNSKLEREADPCRRMVARPLPCPRLAVDARLGRVCAQRVGNQGEVD